MSVTIISRVFWTQFNNIQYIEKSGKICKIGKETTKLVMLAIADSADDWGENSWQSFETIAEKSSIERRSVIRVVKGLIQHKYLSIGGVSKYGTNDYTINLSKLGNAPEKRSKNGRPKTSDSDAITSDSDTETSDSGAITSDPESPYPSLSLNNHPEGGQPKSKPYKKGDLVDMAIDLLDMPGLKKSQRYFGYESLFKTKLNLEVKADGTRWKPFFDFVDKQEKPSQSLITFIDWLLSQPKFDASYWSPPRMRENWPRAFVSSNPQVQHDFID